LLQTVIAAITVETGSISDQNAETYSAGSLMPVQAYSWWVDNKV
jgi:hypothetical protein